MPADPIAPPARPARPVAPAGAGCGPARALLGVGRVRHTRLRPKPHHFDYPSWFLLLPMRTLARQPEPLLRRNRPGWVSFHDRDHGDGGPDSLAWLDALLARAGIADADGEAWLHTLPRVLGLAFKPVSFWYCHRADGALRAVVAEVNNTFGERHAYLLADPQGAPLRWGQPLQAAKVLQVSPFNRIEGGYRFRFLRQAAEATSPARRTQAPAGRTVVRIDLDDGAGPLLNTSVSGDLAPLERRALRAVLWRMPWLSLGVLLRIHGQALRLWWRGVPFFGRDGRVPAAERTLAGPGSNLPSPESSR